MIYLVECGRCGAAMVKADIPAAHVHRDGEPNPITLVHWFCGCGSQVTLPED